MRKRFDATWTVNPTTMVPESIGIVGRMPLTVLPSGPKTLSK
jgi:hypothetical protein